MYATKNTYDSQTPYLAGKSFGFYGMIPLAQLKQIIQVKDTEHQFILIEEYRRTYTFGSLDMVHTNNYPGSDIHGSEGIIFNLHRIHWKDLPIGET
jgi:hypothetical protein